MRYAEAVRRANRRRHLLAVRKGRLDGKPPAKKPPPPPRRVGSGGDEGELGLVRGIVLFTFITAIGVAAAFASIERPECGENAPNTTGGNR